MVVILIVDGSRGPFKKGLPLVNVVSKHFDTGRFKMREV
jgi:hypothetical protein